MMKSSAFKLLVVAACLTAASRVSAQDSTAEETQQTGFAWDNSGDASSSTSAAGATGTSGSASGNSSSTGSNGNSSNGRWHGGGGGNNVPLDAGLSFLLIAGAGVGVKKMLGKKTPNK